MVPTDPVLQQRLADVVASTPGVAWSICVAGSGGSELGTRAMPQELDRRTTAQETDVRTMFGTDPLAGIDQNRQLRTASVGKILLLIELAAQLEAGTLDQHQLLATNTLPAVSGSGFLQYLEVPELSIRDLAVLVAAASDNHATNLLLARVGLDQVGLRAGSLGLRATGLHDMVRDQRGEDTPPTLSTGSALELAGLAAAVAAGSLVSEQVSQQLCSWLATNADTSLVAAAFDLDPLEHAGQAEAGVSLWNKTGTDQGVRADVGWVRLSHRSVAYAAIANWPGGSTDATPAVLAGMREIGVSIKEHLLA